MKHKDFVKELRKDWRYRFWEIVLWLPYEIQDWIIYFQIRRRLKNNEYIHDGFGACWPRWCEDCGAEMHVMRPGDARCSNECYRDDEDENDNTDTD
jgi:hypothetical protein